LQTIARVTHLALPIAFMGAPHPHTAIPTCNHSIADCSNCPGFRRIHHLSPFICANESQNRRRR
jgi:hypothetical protein